MATPQFAVGKRALGICDRCGLTHRLNELKTEYVKDRPNGLRVCWLCLDKDHPQLRHGEQVVDDAEALRDPRPDTNVDDSRTLTGTLVYPPINGAA